jgi:hypothetical protein
VEAPRREIVLPRVVYIAGAILVGGYIVYWLRGVLTPLFLAFLIAYLCDPVVDRLEAWHVPRPAAIALVLGGALSLVGLFLVLVLPLRCPRDALARRRLAPSGVPAFPVGVEHHLRACRHPVRPCLVAASSRSRYGWNSPHGLCG